MIYQDTKFKINFKFVWLEGKHTLQSTHCALEKYEMSRLWADTHTDTQWKVGQYSVRAESNFHIILFNFQGSQHDDEEAKYAMGRLSIFYHDSRKDNSAQEQGSKSGPLRGNSELHRDGWK